MTKYLKANFRRLENELQTLNLRKSIRSILKSLIFNERIANKHLFAMFLYFMQFLTVISYKIEKSYKVENKTFRIKQQYRG